MVRDRIKARPKFGASARRLRGHPDADFAKCLQ
jgi:hypothetical protein